MLLNVDEWNALWASMPSDNMFRDEASDAVISFLVDHGHQPSDQSSDDDPVLALQAAMEIGYILGMVQHGTNDWSDSDNVTPITSAPKHGDAVADQPVFSPGVFDAALAVAAGMDYEADNNVDLLTHAASYMVANLGSALAAEAGADPTNLSETLRATYQVRAIGTVTLEMSDFL